MELNYETQGVKRYLQRIAACEGISKENSALLLQYDRSMHARQLAASTRLKNLKMMLKLAKWCPKPLDALQKEDVFDLVQEIDASNLKPRGKCNLRSGLHTFLQEFLKQTELASCFKVRVPKPALLDQNQLPMRDVVEKVVSSCRKLRTKAIVTALYETGARIGELLAMNREDVWEQDGLLMARLKGTKTDAAPRVVPLGDAKTLSILGKYLASFTGGPQDSLWGTRSYDSVRVTIKSAFKDAGVTERCSKLHHFRHARLTELANKLTHAQLCAFAGWQQGSPMAERYIHTNLKDLTLKFQALYPEVQRKEQVELDQFKLALDKALTVPAYRDAFAEAIERQVQVIVEKVLSGVPINQIGQEYKAGTLFSGDTFHRMHEGGMGYSDSLYSDFCLPIYFPKKYSSSEAGLLLLSLKKKRKAGAQASLRADVLSISKPNQEVTCYE